MTRLANLFVIGHSNPNGNGTTDRLRATLGTGTKTWPWLMAQLTSGPRGLTYAQMGLDTGKPHRFLYSHSGSTVIRQAGWVTEELGNQLTALSPSHTVVMADCVTQDFENGDSGATVWANTILLYQAIKALPGTTDFILGTPPDIAGSGAGFGNYLADGSLSAMGTQMGIWLANARGAGPGVAYDHLNDIAATPEFMYNRSPGGPLAAQAAKDLGYYAADGVHLNDPGSARMAFYWRTYADAYNAFRDPQWVVERTHRRRWFAIGLR